jgi:hypothetical protein
MELSKLNNLKIVSDTSQPYLYFNKYKYSCSIALPMVGSVRYCSSVQNFEWMISTKNYFIEFKPTSFVDFCNIRGGNIEHLKNFVNFRATKKSQCRIMINYSVFTIYANDLLIIEEAISLFGGNSVVRERHDIKNYDKDVIYRKKPMREYRIYLNTKKFKKDEWDMFLSDIDQYKIMPNPSFKKRNRAIYSDDFLDLDDESITMILVMKYPGLVKRICKLESVYLMA